MKQIQGKTEDELKNEELLKKLLKARRQLFDEWIRLNEKKNMSYETDWSAGCKAGYYDAIEDACTLFFDKFPIAD